MEPEHNDVSRPVNPRRKKRSQTRIFKEVYLPVIIAGIAVLLILIFIIGSISRGIQKNRAEKDASIQSSIALQEEQEKLAQQAEQLLNQARLLAADYDYRGAVLWRY